MTPQPHAHRRRVPVRRSAALVAVLLVIGGTPLVAGAIGDDIVAQVAVEVDAPSVRQAEPRLPDRADRSARVVPETVPVTVDPVVVDPVVVDPVVAVLTDTYTWDERGLRVALLQESLGIAVDGIYNSNTQQAHVGAIEFLGLATDIVPVPILPPGPDPAEWAALRECESNGNYAITNPSGKYRGAYQFDRSTWNSVAARHVPRLAGVDPAAASPADQDAMAFALYVERGARPWPQCGRHLA